MEATIFIESKGVIIYIVIILLSIIFNLLGFVVISSSLIILLKFLYFIVLIFAILSIYKNHNRKQNLFILLILPFLILFTGIPFKIVTIALLCPLFLIKDISKGQRFIGISIYLIFIILGIFGLVVSMIFGGFGANTIIDQQCSPNKIYRAITIDSDQGALGGDTFVKLEELYFGIIKRNIRTLYHGNWGEKPKVIWVNNDVVKIDGTDMNIHTSNTLGNK